MIKSFHNILDKLCIKNEKIINLMNKFWIISIILNILSSTLLIIFSKLYISINIFLLAKEIATISLIILTFSFICSIVFENYFLKI